MYKDKNFRIRPLEDVVEDLQMAREYYSRIKVKRVFLADGDALIVKTADLLYILGKVKELFPECERISMYGAPKDILGKTPEELKTLKEAGLDMIYMGIESGDDEVLKFVKKGATQAEMIEAGKKIKDAGMILSVTLISGLGGRKYLKEHAINSAKVITEIKPEYVGFLTLLVEEGTPMYDQLKNGEIELLKPQEVLEEMKLFVSNVDSEGTVFRANHASNYIPLGGTFNRDKESLLAQITEAEKRNTFKSDYFRAL
ncbi:MAG TPA: radical SAM protein, partial [Candidatus Fimicola cottocaccae]|nr:radical SAM protein [Candidatus Fimicola cottocaccae]